MNRFQNTLRTGTVSIALFFLPLSVQAKIEYQSMESILETAKAFTLANLSSKDKEHSVIQGKLDKRLRLKACSTPLEAFFPEYGRRVGNITVGVRCTGKNNWSLFVPMSVQVYRNVVVANKPLARGTVIQQSDLILEKRNISAFSSQVFSGIESVVGMQLTRPVQIGMPINQNGVKQPIAIKRGNLVTLLAKNSSIEVRMEGLALSDGAIGSRIKIKNKRSNRVLEGTVKSSTVVEVKW